MASPLDELVADARAKSDAERRFVEARVELAETEHRLEAIDGTLSGLDSRPSGRRGRRAPEPPADVVEMTGALRERRDELLNERETLRRQARELRQRSNGAELARARLGSELTRREESLRATGGPIVAELDGLEVIRRPLVEKLRRESEVQEHLRTTRRTVDTAEYHLIMDGWETGQRMWMPWQRQSRAVAHSLEARGFGGAAEVKERLEAILVALGDDGRGDEIRTLSTMDVSQLARWFNLVREALSTLGAAAAETSEAIRAELVEIDRRRIELLTAQ